MASSLNRYLEAPLTDKEVDGIFFKMLEEPSRGSAIVAAALVDHALQVAIRHRMVPLTDSETRALFGPDRPLGSFSARTKLAYALGMFGKKTRHDLERLRRIRNAFAHARRDINFYTPEVIDLCKTFNCLSEDQREGLNAREQLAAAGRLLLLHIASFNSTLEAVSTLD
jgi:DNA-binding MltR family transcriptional regulator